MPKWIENFWDDHDMRRDLAHMRERQRREKKLMLILDKMGFSWRIYAVAFLGFLASSWSLIAINIVSPALYFIYPPQGVSAQAALLLDMVTLTAVIIGMLGFGRLADKYGRSALYGFELLIVLGAIGGAAFSSEGYMVQTKDPGQYKSSMNIYASLIFFRFALGLGIGAEYPMSAVIAAEFSSTATRGTMLAAVFLAQPVGRLLAYGLGLGVLRGLTSGGALDGMDNLSLHDEETIIMDKLWRLVFGLAGIPALFAIGLRFIIPETPRYYSAIKRDMIKAKEVIAKMGARSTALQRGDIESMNRTAAESLPGERDAWWSKLTVYLFGPTKGWKPLAAISIQWLLLDIAFYGTGLDSPGTLAALWLDATPPYTEAYYQSVPGFGTWKEDKAYPDARISQTLDDNLTRTLQLSSAAAVAGSLLVIPLVMYQSRKTHYVWTSAALTVLFACMAIAVRYSYAQPSHQVAMVFYALVQFLFNLGPNTLTFVLAAESFPTEFRASLYAVAAASGKLGAIAARGLVKAAGKERQGLVATLSGYSAILFVMTLLAVFEPLGIALPAVQRPREASAPGESRLRGFFARPLGNRSLEDISRWPADRNGDGQATPVSDSDAEGQGANGAVELQQMNGVLEPVNSNSLPAAAT